MEKVGKIKYASNISIVIYSLIISLIVPTALIGFYEFFPDYNNYNQYVMNGTSLERFSAELGSAYVMYLFGIFGFTASEYYWFSTFVFCYCVSFVIASVKRVSKIQFALLLIIFINPIFLIVYQTPRFSSALGFFVLSLFYLRGSWYSVLFILITVSLHTVLGVFGAIFVIISYFRWWLQFVSLFIIIAGFYLVTTGYIDSSYKVYNVDIYERGVGRTIMFLINFFVFIVLSYGYQKNHFIQYSFGVSVMCLSLYFLTPFAHRMTSISLIIILITSSSFFNKERKLIMAILLFFQSLLGLYVLKLGLFGFG
jgi:hypothetical protein